MNSSVVKPVYNSEDNPQNLEDLKQRETLELSVEEKLILKERLNKKQGKEFGIFRVETKLFRSLPFLLAFSLTIMNAFLYVYLALHDFPAIDKRSADIIMQETFGKDYAFFSPVYEFLTETNPIEELSFPEFKLALTKLNGNISKLGVPTRYTFSQHSFHFRGDSIYWSAPIIEGTTTFKPKVD
ncbi:MAG: hypothetical protein GYA55_06125 [SAR324 cluster bacterium]|uniref:Uncharacterized protein n=1 Tax=SAR324 cluster bacterium TaxID=2024889 RepID=A0A7X9FRB4_9DELT|nr:hypothetical protein [SAR324 cluster bacterium]